MITHPQEKYVIAGQKHSDAPGRQDRTPPDQADAVCATCGLSQTMDLLQFDNKEARRIEYWAATHARRFNHTVHFMRRIHTTFRYDGG